MAEEITPTSCLGSEIKWTHLSRFYERPHYLLRHRILVIPLGWDFDRSWVPKTDSAFKKRKVWPTTSNLPSAWAQERILEVYGNRCHTRTEFRFLVVENMASMNVSLPDPMKDWVEAQVQRGKYANSSDYVPDLIHRDQDSALQRFAGNTAGRRSAIHGTA